MPSLPSVSGRRAIRAFERAGFTVVRVRGSHYIMKRPGHPKVITVPVHGNTPIKAGTLRGLIADSGLTVEEFIALLA
jgi:predicted RNA binding protein YcfA (HicA-like mRNA interferase family)